MAALLRAGAPGLTLPRRRRLVGHRLDWTHPLAHSLQCCAVAIDQSTVVDFAKPRIGTSSLAGTVRNRGVLCGANWAFNNSATPELAYTSGQHTLAAIGYYNTNSVNYDNIFCRYTYTSESVNQGWTIQTIASADSSGGGKMCCAILNNNDKTSYRLFSTTSVSIGFWTIAQTCDGTTRRLFINGVQEATSTANMNPAATTSTLFSGNVSGSIGWEFMIGCTWNRALSAGDMLRFHQDPYGMLSPIAPLPLAYWPGDPFNSGAMLNAFPP